MKLKINYFFLLLLALYLLLGVAKPAILAFALVFLHEGVHALAARVLGFKVEEIVLLPFGGVARLNEPLADQPVKEILVALAGPLFNFSLWLLVTYLGIRGIIGGSWAAYLAQINLKLCLFNLLPALPLDGGRVVRGFLSPWLGTVWATRILAFGGQILGAGLMVLGGLSFVLPSSSISLVWMGGFCFWAARQEADLAGYLYWRYLVRRLKMPAGGHFLPTRMLTVSQDATLKEVCDAVRPGSYLLLAVVSARGDFLGWVSETRAISRMLEAGFDSQVKEILD